MNRHHQLLWRSVKGGLFFLLGLLLATNAVAWSLTLGAASRRVFLHVGNGTQNASNGQINLVSVAVGATVLGNGALQAMTSNSGQAASLYDGFQTCPTPASQVLVGASYQRSNAADGPSSASLRVTTPASLTSAAGDVIPFGQISWTVSAPGSSQPNVIPAGTFSGGTQALAMVQANTYVENCHSFGYANAQIVPSGTYNGRATYTLSSP